MILQGDGFPTNKNRKLVIHAKFSIYPSSFNILLIVVVKVLKHKREMRKITTIRKKKHLTLWTDNRVI